ncbi:hypothetical protein [Peribacillus frigoritolerans]|uniref:hypothetical protein n=1 Tax=Peribacillus frigoritolerans TaxID=450367 RepID=UPI0033059727
MIEEVWQRIVENEGNIFKQIRGKQFVYTVVGTSIKLTTTNQLVAKSEFEKAVPYLPLSNTVPIQHLRAPSYIYAILTDKRIID